MEDIDYNKLLDDWADKVLEYSRKHQAKFEESIEYDYTFGYNKGFSNGLAYAVAVLTNMENREKCKHRRNK